MADIAEDSLAYKVITDWGPKVIIGMMVPLFLWAISNIDNTSDDMLVLKGDVRNLEDKINRNEAEIRSLKACVRNLELARPCL